MADKTIKHFVLAQFFTFDDPKYPYDIYDVEFLSKQLALTNNILRSLENQTNKNFELIFIVNEKFFSEPKYEFIFTTLQNSTTLPLKFIKSNEQSQIIKAALNEYEFVIQSKMDFDDFVYKDAIDETQNKVNECDKLLAYGYCRGYSYYDGILTPYVLFWDGVGHIGIMQSLILKSEFFKDLPFLGIYNCAHHVFKHKLKNFFERNNLTFSENMFQQNTSTNAYIYFRHDFSHNSLVSSKSNLKLAFQKAKKLTNEDGITKKYLEEEFGFFYDLNPIK